MRIYCFASDLKACAGRSLDDVKTKNLVDANVETAYMQGTHDTLVFGLKQVVACAFDVSLRTAIQKR